MFYLLNLTQQTRKEHDSKIWPLAAELVTDKFAKPLDTLELVELATANHKYRGIEYIRQEVYTYGMERIDKTGNSYVIASVRAIHWLREQRKIKASERLIVPKPRCKICLNTFEGLGDVQSIRDCGRCTGCRAKLMAITSRDSKKKKL